MSNPSQSATDAAAKYPAIYELFRQAAASGRNTLNQTELGSLLSGLGVSFAAAVPAGPLALRISLNNTREFGMVISAGMGGPDADLDEDNFKKDRASVYAAVELTDAAGFLDLFKRTRISGLPGSAGKQGAAPLMPR
jgi:hypothetical protein